ncbi:MAG: flagellar motor protein MotB [Pseudomonadota bacterium]|nr:flagellar motor protein MotB [Pseudomonadota bacterium]
MSRARGRKVRHEEHENHERWLVSYADFITLLFAFFTVLYATAQTDQNKLVEVVAAMNAAFDGGMSGALMDVMRPDLDPPDLPEVPPTTVAQEVASPLLYSIKQNLQGSLSDNVVQVGIEEQELTIVLPERLLFAPGSAELHPTAYALLAQVVEALAGAPATVEVVGRADAAPVAPGGKWADNWALASARGLTTARYLVKRGLTTDHVTASATVGTVIDAELRTVTLRVRVDESRAAGEVVERLPLP